MKKEAEINAEADRKARELADKMNEADSMIFQTEKNLREYGDKIPADKKSLLESALQKLKSAHASKDINQINDALKQMNSAWNAASQDLYQAMNQQQANSSINNSNANSNGSASGSENVTDVDYEEVK